MQAFHDYYAEYEALATWMQAEWHAAKAPRDFDTFVKEQITDFQKSENDALPPRIPDNVVLSLPGDSVARTTTNGMPMWLWDYRYGANVTWDPSRPATASRSVPAALTAFNTTAAGGGFTDWHAPSRGDIDGLLANRFTNGFPTNVRGLFLKILPGGNVSGTISDTSAPVLWTSEAPPQVRCLHPRAGGASGAVTNYEHTSFGPIDLTSLRNYPTGFAVTPNPSFSSIGVFKITNIIPGFPSDWAFQAVGQGLTDAQALAYCQTEMARRVTAQTTALPAVGRLSATRTAGTSYMP